MEVNLDYPGDICQLHTQQAEALDAFLNDEKHFFAIYAHRRFGKDFVAMIFAITGGLKAQGNIFYVAPYFRQVKDIVVEGKTVGGMNILDFLIPSHLLKPLPLRDKVNKSDWSITLYNGSKIFLRGADQPDSLVGIGAMGLIITEMTLVKPIFFKLLYPAISKVIRETNQGFILMIGTPRGKLNWANRFFVDYFSGKMPPSVKKKWYIDVLPATITTKANGERLLSDEDLVDEKYMMEDPGLYEQEYLCSFNAVNPGAFYKDQIKQAFVEGRIKEFGEAKQEVGGKLYTYDNYYWKNAPVYISWDIGMRDNTVLWFYQRNPRGGIRFIHHYRNNGLGMEHYSEYIFNWLREHKVGYVLNILPHDGDQREWASASKRSDKLKDLGHNVFTLTKTDMARNDMQRLISQINEIRKAWTDIEIDYNECFEGVDKLINYVKKFNKATQEYIDKPDHDANNKASDDADSFRTGVLYYTIYLKGSGMPERNRYEVMDEFDYEDVNSAYDY